MSVWPKTTIGEVCRIVNGGTPKTNVAAYWNGEHSWITPAEMGKRDTPYIAESVRTLTDAGLKNSAAQLLPRNSLILSSRAPIGYIVINTEPAAFNQGCKGLVPDDSLYYKYLYYFLASAIELLNDLGTGATFKELSAAKLKTVELPLPPLAEQKRIVAILDRAFAGIDTAITDAEKNLANAHDLFESWVTGVFSRPGEEWVVKRLDTLAENLDSKRVPVTKSERTSGDVPYYGASGVVDHVADYIFDEDLLLVSEDGANLLARTYPIAFSISGKAWVNNHAHVLRFPDCTLQRFVEYYLNAISLEPYVSGMAQPKLNQKALNTIPIPVPPREDQVRMVATLDALASETERLGAVYQRKLSALAELKQSILQKAFAGELTAKEAERELAAA
jgi:type I restriction enzyme, S subunit